MKHVYSQLSKVKLSLCLTNQALLHEGIWGNGCIDSHFLDLGSSWRWVVSLTPRPLHPRYPSYRRVGGLQPVWTPRRKFLTIQGLELRSLDRLAHSQSLYRLRYPCSVFSVEFWAILRFSLALAYSYCRYKTTVVKANCHCTSHNEVWKYFVSLYIYHIKKVWNKELHIVIMYLCNKVPTFSKMSSCIMLAMKSKDRNEPGFKQITQYNETKG
jgi:hypothetical protein